MMQDIPITYKKILEYIIENYPNNEMIDEIYSISQEYWYWEYCDGSTDLQFINYVKENYPQFAE